MRWACLAGSLMLLFWPGAGQAKWLRASSAHFVIYADDAERNVRRFSDQLERYHAAVLLMSGRKEAPPSPSNRVAVYVLPTSTALRNLFGPENKNYAGRYMARAAGSVAFLSAVSPGKGKVDFSMAVLLHEYAHHLMHSLSGQPMPRWMSEGGAEFYAASSFGGDGSVTLGGTAWYRVGGLLYGPGLRVEELLDDRRDQEKTLAKGNVFYGRSWLLFHYLSFDQARKGQLAKYLALLAGGTAARPAAEQAFGDLASLNRDLDSYQKRTRIDAVRLPPDLLSPGAIDVRPLGPGEAAMMPVRVRSAYGVDAAGAKALVAEARAIAARFPADPAVLSALAEAEYDAGNDKEAIAAADAALAVDPAQVNAYVQKGYALFRRAESADDRAAAYALARAPFIALNRLENDHPLPLIYFYRSYVDQGLPPPPLALAGLVRALELAPFDDGLRMTLASALLAGKRQADARIVLGPVAYDPHGGELAEQARKMLARLDREPGWTGEDPPETAEPATAQ
ncbi:hypothetical protein ACMT1E_10320 [Sphingomonas flavalba]|uniref:hypothetical protein n=1 Tax=Sphingomonas flavalba TaxID=2559804 RepID=UPI0039DF6CA3